MHGDWVGTQSNGQGHETSFAQVLSELLGLPIDAFHLVQGDTARVPSGGGHGGARSLHMGGAALHGAAQALGRKGGSAAATGVVRRDRFRVGLVPHARGWRGGPYHRRA